jgi:hypothetical protein
MKRPHDFDNILDECLQRLVQGESIEACLSEYPEHAAELEPLLRTAADTLRAADIRPRHEFRQRASYEFQKAVREMPVKESRGFLGVFKPWMVTLIVVVVVLAAGSGTVAAASNSLPDSPLYAVKLATESVRLALTPSALGKAELYTKFADERVEEILLMADKGNSNMVDKATDRLNEQLIAVANLNVTGKTKEATFAGATLEEAQPSEAAEAAPKALMAPSPAPPSTTVPSVTPTTTSTPTPTAVPAPDGSPPPAITAIPAPEVEPPSIVTAPPAEQEAGGLNKRTFGLDSDHELDKQQKLKQDLTNQALKNLQALREKLENAPESLKPSLLRAIQIAEEAYEEALENLD